MHGWSTWNTNWLWSLVLIAITIAIHVAGVVAIAKGLEGVRNDEQRRHLAYLESTAGTILVIVVVALWLAFLHGLESMVWALAYVKLGAISSASDAALYSVDSMTTRGASGLFLEKQWRLMGATEAGDGMLLFGISTAFLFFVMIRFFKTDPQLREP
jgi:hypothetical protein